MFSREFTFTDYNGNEKKATYWFSLEKDEMLRRELGNYGGLEYTMRQLLKEKRQDKVLDMLEDIVLSAVGEVSPDGESFYKSKEVSDRFKQTKVCHDLLFELMSTEDGLKNFMMGAMPAEVSAKWAEAQAAEAAGEKSEGANVVPLNGGSNT